MPRKPAWAAGLRRVTAFPTCVTCVTLSRRGAALGKRSAGKIRAADFVDNMDKLFAVMFDHFDFIGQTPADLLHGAA